MRLDRIATVAALLIASSWVGAGHAQVAESPLSQPDAPVAVRKPPAKAAKPANKAHVRKSATASSLPPRAAPTVPSAEGTPPAIADDPLSFGFKWQGTNDTAEKTRVQNYNGTATGTGAAVGLKLHF